MEASHSCKILIADDEFLVRWSLSEALSQDGYHVIAVDNGKKAVEAAQAEIFDFVITDLKMPELDGWEVLTRVQQIRSTCKVIIITAHGGEDSEMIARDKGAWAYVEKPFIIGKIRELLKGQLWEEYPRI